MILQIGIPNISKIGFFVAIFLALLSCAMIGALLITVLLFILNKIKVLQDEPINYFKLYLILLSFFIGALFIIGIMITAPLLFK